MASRQEWATTAYRHRLQNDSDFLRVRLRIERGVVVRFTVQFEAVVEGQTYPVVRYDSAHGGAHRDTLDWHGNVIAKDWIEGKPYARIVNEGIDDIKTNWHSYREAFLRRKP